MEPFYYTVAKVKCAKEPAFKEYGVSFYSVEYGSLADMSLRKNKFFQMLYFSNKFSQAVQHVTDHFISASKLNHKLQN